jgi:hypothetical protein
MIESYGNKVPWSNIAEQRRAEIEACPEFVRVYIMGLEDAANKLERLLAYDTKLQNAVVSAHVRALPDNWEFIDPLTSLDLLCAEIITAHKERDAANASEAQLARMAGEYERLYREILGPMLTRCRIAQDAEHGGPKHDDTHTPAEWAEFVRKFAGRAEYQGQYQDNAEAVARYQAAMIDVAGLAISAVLSSQRKVRGELA